MDLCLPIARQTVQDLIHEIYLHLHHITFSISESGIQKYFSQRVILAARNVNIDTINNTSLQMLPGNVKIYSNADSAFNYPRVTNDSIPNEYINTITVPGMPLHETTLKLKCLVILLPNLKPHERLRNSAQIVITAIAEQVIKAQILTGTHAGKKAIIPRILLDTLMSTGLRFILCRQQQPIQLGLRMSINKAQGQSLNQVGLYLNNPVFAHGQLYIALSKCTNCRNLRILLPLNTNRRTLNIVYREVINSIAFNLIKHIDCL